MTDEETLRRVWAWLPHFAAAVRHGGFSAAAAHLHIHHSAVSRAIKQLEETLGYEVLVRSARGTELSARGRPLFEALERATHGLLGAVGSGKQAGQLRIAYMGQTDRYVLIPAIEQISALGFDLRVIPITHELPDALKQLKEGSLDLLLAVNVVEGVPLKTLKIASPSLVVAIGARHPAFKKTLTARELVEAYTFVWTGPRSGMRPVWPKEVSRKVGLQVDSHPTGTSAVLSGGFLSLTERPAIQHLIDSGELRAVPADFAEPPDVNVIGREHVIEQPPLDAVVRILRDVAQRTCTESRCAQ